MTQLKSIEEGLECLDDIGREIRDTVKEIRELLAKEREKNVRR